MRPADRVSNSGRQSREAPVNFNLRARIPPSRRSCFRTLLITSIQKEITMSQGKNVAIAQQLLAGIGEGKDPEVLARLFAEDLRFEIQGDDGVLPWIGQKRGRAAAADFFRKIRVLTEPVKFEVEDILASDGRAAIVGELATRIKSSGKICTSQFAIILTISGDAITRFQMLEDSFGLSKAVHS